MMNKKNPVAQSLRERQFHQRIVRSKKLYARHKEKGQIYAHIQQGDQDDRLGKQ